MWVKESSLLTQIDFRIKRNKKYFNAVMILLISLWFITEAQLQTLLIYNFINGLIRYQIKIDAERYPTALVFKYYEIIYCLVIQSIIFLIQLSSQELH